MGGGLSKVFLSYAHADRERISRLATALKAMGCSVWWDHLIGGGTEFAAAIEQGLEEADYVVVGWSRNSIQSHWVRDEAEYARIEGKLVPISLDGVLPPMGFRQVQSLDFSTWNGEDNTAELEGLAHALGRQLPQPSDPAPTAEALQRARPTSERRQIVFLAAKLDEGEQQAGSIDPEDWHDFLVRLKAACQPPIVRYRGHANWHGQDVTVTFGFPVAQEDAAQRAIRCAQEMARMVARLDRPGEPGRKCSIRCGIHSSEMLVTTSHGETELIGDGAALAETARDTAEPGSIAVTSAIKVLASGAFRIDPVLTQAEGQQFFSVSEEAPDKASARGWETAPQSAFVGRADELAHLRRRWDRTLDARGQLVLIRGEPGIGKSRLIEQFRNLANETDHVWLSLQGSSLFPNTPFFSLTQMIDLPIDIAGADQDGVLEARLAEIGLSIDLAPLLVSILAHDGDDRAGSIDANASIRSEFLSRMVDSIFQLAQDRPVILFADDLQWVDPSTLELLKLLAEQSEDDRLLILGTARPEFDPPWSENDHHSRINLARLPNAHLVDLVNEAAGDEPFDSETLQTILEKADGVPLFAEELAKLASSERGSRIEKLPVTLRSLLAARMDRLGPARELLQVCSVLGACPYPIVAAMMEIPDQELNEQLRQLTEEQLINVRGMPPHSNYRFKHSLLQDGAYETLTRNRRKTLHAKAAGLILEQFPDVAESQSELVAMHWTKAEMYEQAIVAWFDTGRREHRRGASREAAAHLGQGIELVQQLPEGPERDEYELELSSAKSEALQKSLGYSHPETIAASDRARDLARKLGSLERLALGETQLWRATVNAGHYDDADQLAKRISSLIEEIDNDKKAPWMAEFANTATIQTAFYGGRLSEFDEPYAELEKSFGKVDDLTNIDGHIVSIGVGSLAAWMAGNSRLARHRIAQAIELAENSKQPYAIAVAHHFAGTMMAFDEDLACAKAHTERALAVCKENGIEALGHLVRAKIGWLNEQAAPSAESIATMRAILDAMVAANARVGLVINMNRLAMALEARGEFEEAYTAVCEALGANPQERIVRPETLLLKGRIEAGMGREEQAMEDLQQAVELAREIGAKSFELSAGLELARFLERNGKSGEAMSTLERIVSSCGPEVDTPALARASALLTEIKARTAG